MKRLRRIEDGREEDETNRLLALEEAEKQRKQQDFENQ